MLWLERKWISDVDLTVADNPGYERMNAERQKGFSSLFGKTRWRFHDGFFESKTAQGTYSYPYFVRPIDAESFEILFSMDGAERMIEISKRPNGFCAKWEPVW